MKKIPVLHMIDSLELGGAEQMAVKMVNGLVGNTYQPHLCVTRQLGPLITKLDHQVTLLHLNRKNRFDIYAVRKCIEYVQANNFRLIHAHGTSIFFALLLTYFIPNLLVLWHVHHGGYSKDFPDYKNIPYRWAARNSSGIVCVSLKLKQWATMMKATEKQIWYLPNFSIQIEPSPQEIDFKLPGEIYNRVICVSNLRPQKDHITLLEAWKHVIGQCPHAHLFLVGGATEPGYAQQILSLAETMIDNVTWLGTRTDIPFLLENCQIGVLSSRSEGFPVTLLEYGWAKLGVVATDVGQCADILDGGNAGLLVPPGNSRVLAEAMVSLLTDETTTKKLGNRLFEHVSKRYSQDIVLNHLSEIYSELISK